MGIGMLRTEKNAVTPVDSTVTTMELVYQVGLRQQQQQQRGRSQVVSSDLGVNPLLGPRRA